MPGKQRHRVHAAQSLCISFLFQAQAVIRKRWVVAEARFRICVACTIDVPADPRGRQGVAQLADLIDSLGRRKPAEISKMENGIRRVNLVLDLYGFREAWRDIGQKNNVAPVARLLDRGLGRFAACDDLGNGNKRPFIEPMPAGLFDRTRGGMMMVNPPRPAPRRDPKEGDKTALSV